MPTDNIFVPHTLNCGCKLIIEIHVYGSLGAKAYNPSDKKRGAYLFNVVSSSVDPCDTHLPFIVGNLG